MAGPLYPKPSGSEGLTPAAPQKPPAPLEGPAPPGAFAVTWEWGRDQRRGRPIGCAVGGRDSQ